MKIYLYLRKKFREFIFKFIPESSIIINYLVKIDLLIRRLKILDIALNGKFFFRDCVFYYHKNDISIASSILTNGDYEPETLNAIESILKPESIFIDGGSNIGFYSILASKLVGENGKIFAFEPTSLTREYLTKNINANNIKNIFVSEYAITAQDGEITFNITDNSETNSVVQAGQSITRGINKIQKAIKIDTFCKNHKIFNVDLMKLDIEGQELEAIKSSEHIIKNSQDLKIIFELNLSNSPNAEKLTLNIFNLLLKYGYQHFELLLSPKIIINPNKNRSDLSKLIQICKRYNVNVLAKK